MVTRQPLTALGVESDEVSRLFDPFVTRRFSGDMGDWRAEIKRRKRKILKKAMTRTTMGWRSEARRDERTVREEYARAWEGIRYDIYRIGGGGPSPTPWVWNDRCLFALDTGATRFRQLMLIRTIERLRPASVLEVGCGNGINLLLLSGRFPEVRFSGVELTSAGHEAATRFQQRESLPEGLVEYAPEPLRDPLAFKRIDFIQGNAAALPFEDGAVDLVYSTLALEQMERIRPRVLAEFARVAKRNTLMIEPFRDVNGDFWPRLYVYQRNYFRGGVEDLSGYGLMPIVVTSDFPQEWFLKAAAVLCERQG